MSTHDHRNAKLNGNRGRVVPTQLAHIVRRTSRFEAMCDWYQTVLGAEIVHSDGVLAFLSYDAEHHPLDAKRRFRGEPDRRHLRSR